MLLLRCAYWSLSSLCGLEWVGRELWRDGPARAVFLVEFVVATMAVFEVGEGHGDADLEGVVDLRGGYAHWRGLCGVGTKTEGEVSFDVRCARSCRRA